MVLYSADAFGLFPWDAPYNGPNPLTGLTDLGHSYESWPEPCMMCVVEINIAEGINGTFTDTFDIISDTPEPAAFLLVGSALMLLGLRLRRR